MGCSISSGRIQPYLYPDFYIAGALITKKQVELIEESWNSCLRGTSAYKEFVLPPTDPSPAAPEVEADIHGNALPSILPAAGNEVAHDPSSPGTLKQIQPSPITFIFNTFYSRLFFLMPFVKPLFKRHFMKQGEMLVKMISLTVKIIANPEIFHAELGSLARRHVRYGVLVSNYGPVCEILLFTLEKCCGPDVWKSDVAEAWAVAVSAMLSVIVPAAVEAEACFVPGIPLSKTARSSSLV